MENNVIMNEVKEEVIEEAVEPMAQVVADTAEEYCEHCSNKGSHKFMTALGTAGLICLAAAGVVMLVKRHRKNKADEADTANAEVIDAPDNFSFDDDDDEEKDE
ncbi:MAG: hypothetical protein NC078_08430 [Ruminococcus sp.]|nr:hypothetical protein [Ruminococcus sp.]